MKKFLCAVVLLACGLMALGYAVFYRGFYVELRFWRRARRDRGFWRRRQNPAGARSRGRMATPDHPRRGAFQRRARPARVTAVTPPEKKPITAGLRRSAKWARILCAFATPIFDAAFYNAFYRFNTESGRTLYLLQGLSVTDHANNSLDDAYAPGQNSTARCERIRWPPST